jgi:hypothetical protein
VLGAVIQLQPLCPLIRGALDYTGRSGYKVPSLSVGPYYCHSGNPSVASVHVAPTFPASPQHLGLQQLHRISECGRLDYTDEPDPAGLEVECSLDTREIRVRTYNTVASPVPRLHKAVQNDRTML